MLFDSLLNSQRISRNKIFSIIKDAPRIISKLKEKASNLFSDNKNETPRNKIVDTTATESLGSKESDYLVPREVNHDDEPIYEKIIDPTTTLPANTVTGIAVADNSSSCGIINYSRPSNFTFSFFAGNAYKKIKETFSWVSDKIFPDSKAKKEVKLFEEEDSLFKGFFPEVKIDNDGCVLAVNNDRDFFESRNIPTVKEDKGVNLGTIDNVLKEAEIFMYNKGYYLIHNNDEFLKPFVQNDLNKCKKINIVDGKITVVQQDLDNVRYVDEKIDIMQAKLNNVNAKKIAIYLESGSNKWYALSNYGLNNKNVKKEELTSILKECEVIAHNNEFYILPKSIKMPYGCKKINMVNGKINIVQTDLDNVEKVAIYFEKETEKCYVLSNGGSNGKNIKKEELNIILEEFEIIDVNNAFYIFPKNAKLPEACKKISMEGGKIKIVPAALDNVTVKAVPSIDIKQQDEEDKGYDSDVEENDDLINEVTAQPVKYDNTHENEDSDYFSDDCDSERETIYFNHTEYEAPIQGDVPMLVTEL
ncbi:hypothetical protein [Rickettsia endosymbiont of Orchestes rusci]|uniref:hypothetical protein n=1 Tax=Rickettsia endosymbiont of Orchestes rusci TaxID=3066250 RepID=UPI00313C44E2